MYKKGKQFYYLTIILCDTLSKYGFRQLLSLHLLVVFTTVSTRICFTNKSSSFPKMSACLVRTVLVCSNQHVLALEKFPVFICLEQCSSLLFTSLARLSILHLFFLKVCLSFRLELSPYVLTSMSWLQRNFQSSSVSSDAAVYYSLSCIFLSSRYARYEIVRHVICSCVNQIETLYCSTP